MKNSDVGHLGRPAGTAAKARLMFTLAAALASAACAPANMMLAQSGNKINIAHRGASAYAPEHTIHAYLLAIEQRADYVEQDLQITKDGILVCLHDLTLERTTNVEEVVPDRYRDVTRLPKGNPRIQGELTNLAISGFSALGQQSTNPQWQDSTVYNPKVNYAWIYRKHSIKVGYEYQYMNVKIQDVNPLNGALSYAGQFSRATPGRATSRAGI